MAITLADEAPRVMVTRNHRIPGARYFGPVPEDLGGARDHRPDDQGLPDPHLLRLELQARRWQTGRPCFPGQIGRCGGPCSQKVTIEEHRAIVDQFVAFMASHDRTRRSPGCSAR